MKSGLIQLHPRAIEEARAAYRWYAQRSHGAAQRFLLALDAAVAKVEAGPLQWPTYLLGTRFVKLARYPYLLVYTIRPLTVQVIAIAHARRRPGYWRRRLPP